MVEWKITNIVFTINFNIPLLLDKIAGILGEYKDVYIDYEPGTFPGLILHLDYDNKKIKMLIFSNGIINIAGLKSMESLYGVIEKLREVLKRANIELPNNYELKITNVVVNGKFDYDNIDIEKIYKDFDETNYDPERFPAISISYYISKDYKVVFNIFKTGKFICAGIKPNKDDLYQHIDKVVNSFQENVIKKYVKQ